MASGARVAIVTGGTRGVGKGIVAALVAAGHQVVACAREVAEVPDGVVFEAVDVRDPDATSALVQRVLDRFGGLAVVVNNAGGSPPADAATASPRFTEAVIRLNLLAPLHLSQAANAAMQHQGDGGVIVNIASLSGMRPSPTAAAYGAAKAGLINATATLAVEWAPKVRVCCITLGLVRTENSDLHYGDDLAAIEATVPLGRMATPEDVGAAVAWATSPAASYFSGGNLVLHGGGERPPYHQVVARHSR